MLELAIEYGFANVLPKIEKKVGWRGLQVCIDKLVGVLWWHACPGRGRGGMEWR